ncbi:MAG: radical SAM protein, partial [Bacillota bacterium]|nr:radical SAM protein [Bacillota bacterium]
MAICTLCPRMCKADRAKGEKGFCLMTDEIVLSRAALHYWEEPCISGDRGSGTVFFSGCSLKCVYCQNRPVALNQAGKAVSIERLAEIFCELQEKKAHNINLVTPTHYVPEIIEAVNISRQKGLNIPIVYNSGGYENTDTIKLLDGIIDVYMPDFKYMSSSLSEKYSNASNYSEIVKEAIEAMVSQVGDLEFDEDGMMKKGVLIRHMLLPGCLDDSKEVMKYLYDTYKEKVYYSI